MSRFLLALLGGLLLAISLNGAARQDPASPRDNDPLTPTTTPSVTLSPTLEASATATATATPITAATTTETPSPTVTATATAAMTPGATITATAVPLASLSYLPIAYFQAPPAPAGCQPLPSIPPASHSSEANMVAVLNAFRQSEGKPALVWNSATTQASRRHAEDMAQNGIQGFIGSDDSNPGDRLREACYDWVTVGQIIGWGYADPAAMAALWIGSPAHTALLLDSLYDDLGPAYAFEAQSTWQHYWAVTLAQPAGPNIRMRDETAVPYTCTYEISGPGGGSRAIWTQKEPCTS